MSENQFREFIKNTILPDAAHDMTHIERVVASAKKFAILEKANVDVVVSAAWLHDCVTVKKTHLYALKHRQWRQKKQLIF